MLMNLQHYLKLLLVPLLVRKMGLLLMKVITYACTHAYMHTHFIQVEVIPLVKMFVAVMEGSKLLDVLELSWVI